MALVESLEFKVTADGQPAVSAFGRVGAAARTELGSAEKSVIDLRTAMSAALGATVGVGLVQGIESVARGLVSASKASAADAASQTVLAATLRNSAEATELQVASTEKFITTASRMAGVVDDEIRPAFGVLVRSTQDIGDAQSLLSTTLDISAGTGRDVTSVATALAKAYEGDTVALKRLLPEVGGLIRDGATFSEILQTLQSDFRGLAAERGASDPIARLNVSLDDFRENVGAGVLPVISSLNTGVSEIRAVFGTLPDEVQGAVSSLFGTAAASAVVVGGLTLAGGAVLRLKSTLDALTAASAASALSEVAAAASTAAVATETAAAATAGAAVTSTAASAAVAAGATTAAAANTALAASAATTAVAVGAETATQLALFDAAGQATFAIEAEATGQLALFDATRLATGGLVAQTAAQRGMAISAGQASAANATNAATATQAGGGFLKAAGTIAVVALATKTAIDGIRGSTKRANEELAKAFSEGSDDQLAEAGRRLQAIGKETSTFDNVLKNSIGTAQRYVDVQRSLGREMGDYQAKIDKATAAQKQLKADQEAANRAISGGAGAARGVTGAYDEAAVAAANLARRTAELKVAQSALSGALSLGNAKVGFNDAITALTEGTKAAGGRAQTELDVERATRGVTSAERDLAAAEENLRTVRAGATADEKARLQLRKEFADLAAEDSQRNVAEAQNDLRRAQRRGTVKEIDDAGRALRRAQLDNRQAIFASADAQKEQNEVNNRGKEGSKELAAAVLEVEDAQFRLREAIAATQQQAGGGQVERSAKEQRELFGQAASNAGDILQAMIDAGVPADVVAKLALELEGKLGLAATNAGITREEFEKTRDALRAILFIGQVVGDLFGPQAPDLGKGGAPGTGGAAPGTTIGGPTGVKQPTGPVLGPPAPDAGLKAPGFDVPTAGFTLPAVPLPPPPVPVSSGPANVTINAPVTVQATGGEVTVEEQQRIANTIAAAIRNGFMQSAGSN